MTPKRRKNDAPVWWHARVSYVLALLATLLFAPTVWTAMVGGAIRTVDRLGDAEHDIQALRRDVQRIDHELQALHERRH